MSMILVWSSGGSNVGKGRNDASSCGHEGGIVVVRNGGDDNDNGESDMDDDGGDNNISSDDNVSGNNGDNNNSVGGVCNHISDDCAGNNDHPWLITKLT